jgi:putative cardiolipin synthetase
MQFYLVFGNALAVWFAEWGWLLSALYFITIAATVLLVILDKRDPTKTTLWVVVLVLLPVLGFLLYLFFGRNLRRSRIYKRKKPIDLSGLRESIDPYMVSLPEWVESTSSSVNASIARLLLNNSRSPVLRGNRAKVYHQGREAFGALLADIESAREFIHLEYYIWSADTIGTIMAELLMAKARAGLDVRILYDAVGSWGLSKRYVRELQEAGVQIFQFQRVRFPYFADRLNYRNHRKIAVIDGTIGHMGGMNVADKYMDGDPKLGSWYDSQLRLVGPSVAAMHLIFINDWDFVTHYAHPFEFHRVEYPNTPENVAVQVAASGPETNWATIMQAYFTAIAKARHHIYICSPYFVPNESILTALRTASLSGVEVRILLPAKSDSRFVHWATRSYIQTLLDAEIQVYLFQGGFNHSKTVMIDSTCCTIGSANMDIRSFEDNFEVVALVYDSALTQEMEADFLVQLERSQRVSPIAWRERGFPDRFKDAVASLFSPLF